MKIERMELFPTIFHFNIPHQLTPFFEVVLLRLWTDEGIYGIGEAPAFPQYLGDTREHITKAFSMFWNILKGSDPFKIAQIHAQMDHTFRFHGTKATQMAIDMALYDLMGKALKRPIHDLLGGAYRTQFQTIGHINESGLGEIAQAAKELLSKGYAAIEVKAGFHLEQGSMAAINKEVDKIKTVLKECPPEVLVVADFNQEWRDPKVVISVLNREFGGVPNLAIEQPIHYLNLQGMREIREKTEIPIIADEAVFSPEATLRIIENRAADIFSVRISRVGGIFKALKVLALIEAAGLQARIDTLPYSRIGDTALAHLASIIRVPFPLSCDGHQWIVEDPAGPGGVIMPKGIAQLPLDPGLGIDLDEKFLSNENQTVLRFGN